MQVAYGIATSTEVAYFTYIYAKISGEHYRLVCISGDYEKLAKMRPGYKLDKGLSPSWSISLWHNFASACLHVLDRLQVVDNVVVDDVVAVVVVNVVVADVVVFVVDVVIVVDLHGFRGLNYVSLAMVSCATCVSFFLPSVQSAIYFHRQVPQVQQMLSYLPTFLMRKCLDLCSFYMLTSSTTVRARSA